MNKTGFTFAEVLISLFVLTVSMYIYTNLQFRATSKIRNSTDAVFNLFAIKKQLYDLYLNAEAQKKPTKITVERNVPVTITTRKKSINKKKSSLKGFFKEIDILTAKGTWKDGLRTKSSTMLTFVRKPNEKK